MNFLTVQKPTSLLIVDNLTKRIMEMEVTPEDALEELAYLDPETELGRAMTKVMVNIVALKLLDFYKGYTRQDNEIKIIMSSEAPVENLKKLVSEIEREVETVSVGSENNTPVIDAELIRTNMNAKDFEWIVKLNVFVEEPDGYGDVPVQIDMDGEISVNGEEEPVEGAEEL